MSTLRHFAAEYEAHVSGGGCLAGQCGATEPAGEPHLDLCGGCARCEQACPVPDRSEMSEHAHLVDEDRCLRCGSSLEIPSPTEGNGSELE